MEDSYFNQKQKFEVKNILMMDLFLTNTQFFTSQNVNWWTGIMWIIVMYLLAVFIRTLILTAPIHCKGSIVQDVMLNYSKYVLMNKTVIKLIYILDDLRVIYTVYI